MDENKLHKLASGVQNAMHLVTCVRNALAKGEGQNEFSDSYAYVLMQAENKMYDVMKELNGEKGD